MPYYDRKVFINCPFDDEYKPLFRGIVFALIYCGLNPKSALETRNSGQARMDKLYDLIESSKYSIHDISRVTLDPSTNLPRFNMPFELGLFLGAKRYGEGRQGSKNCLILEETKYDYQKYLSDISGQDASSHGGVTERAMEHVRNWVLTFRNPVPSSAVLIEIYKTFTADLPQLCSIQKFDIDNLQYLDYVNLVTGWLAALSSVSTSGTPSL